MPATAFKSALSTLAAPCANAALPDRFMRLPEVKRVTGLSTSSIYRQMKARRFPAPIPLLHTRVVVWLESQIAEFMAAQIASHRQSEPHQ